MAMEPSGGKAKTAPASGKKIPEHVGRGKLPAASRAANSKASGKKTAGKPSRAVTAPIPDDRRYEIDRGMETLHRAEQIRNDTKLMRDMERRNEEHREMFARAKDMMRRGVVSKRHIDRMRKGEPKDY